jgi:3-oxoacyl-[acyl-carrier-protein] synthase-3
MKPIAKIIGTGQAVPQKIVTNYDLEKLVDTSNEWIFSQTGIRERRFIETGTDCSDLCAEAARQAIKEAGMKAIDLDLIIVCTITGDMRFPATAVITQGKIGASKAAAFDLSAACAGFLYGISFAESIIKANKYRNILVIGVEVLSFILDMEDRNTCVLFGDGGGAAVLVPSHDDTGILSTYLAADGGNAQLLYSRGGGTAGPPTRENLENGEFYIHMDGRKVFLHAVKRMSEAALCAMKQADINGNDIDLFIPHQANIRIIEATAKSLGVPIEKVYINIDKYGNTSAGSIPIALNEARRKGILQKGMTVLLVAFGAGFTWASSVIKF